jgi:hypothetical protein
MLEREVIQPPSPYRLNMPLSSHLLPSQQHPLRILRRQNRRILRDEYYDQTTTNLFRDRLTDDEKNNIRRNALREHQYLRGQWATIVLSLSDTYLDEYYSLRTQLDRNRWIEKYLNVRDMIEMPATLLPL